MNTAQQRALGETAVAVRHGFGHGAGGRLAGRTAKEAGGKSVIFPLRRGPDSAILAAPCQTSKKIPTIFGIRL